MPAKSEGFESIHKLEFITDDFQNEEDRKCYEENLKKWVPADQADFVLL